MLIIFCWISKDRTGRLFDFHKDALTSACRRPMHCSSGENFSSLLHVFLHTLGMRIEQARVADNAKDLLMS